MNIQTAEERAKLLGSFLLFTRVFYKLRTGREFELAKPLSKEPHHITIARALTKVLRGETKRLIINVPPRYGKTELLIHFIAWAIAHYPDSNFLYISYALNLAKKQTQTVREILTMSQYKKIFGIELSQDSTAKDNFETVQKGSVYATGAGGTITGRGAGIQNCKRFGGAIIIDDIHKPGEVSSDTMRDSVNNWYLNTLQSRVNSPDTPVIFIGQRLHEDDLAANLIKGFDGHEWDIICLPALDNNNQALHPTMHTVETLQKMQEIMPYEFSAQYQQAPQPAGGGIFKKEWFAVMDEEPAMLATFVVADTAETEKSYNDATVFSFFGVYKIKQLGQETGMLGLHWIDCVELRIEPHQLQDEFYNFYRDCMMHKIKPKIAAIEKKSTGVTLLSVLQKMQGLQVMEINRDRSSGNKTDRFLATQPFVASKRVSISAGSKHKDLCINHMAKITANNTHRFDDIADTLADGVKLALADNVIYRVDGEQYNPDLAVSIIADSFARKQSILRQNYG